MGDTKAELDKRLTNVEEIGATGRGIVRALMFMVVLMVPALTTAAAITFGFLFSSIGEVRTGVGDVKAGIGELKTGLGVAGEKITSLKSEHGATLQSIKEQGARDVTAIKEQSVMFREQYGKDLASLKDAIKALGGTAYTASSPPHDRVGKLLLVKNDVLVLEQRFGETVVRYISGIVANAKVVIKEKAAKLDDLRPGMIIRIVHDGDGRVTSIETAEERELPTSLPPPLGQPPIITQERSEG